MISDLPDLIAKRAELTPDKVALEEVATGRSVTYAELAERVLQDLEDCGPPQLVRLGHPG